MELSSHEDFEKLLFTILDPLKPYFTAQKSGITLGETGATYDTTVIGLEAFSRLLWAISPYWQGKGGRTEFEEIYLQGIIAGTDPENPAYWGSPKDYDQRFVEMAAIAAAILEAPEKIWQPLSEKEKNNLATWLNTINQYFIPKCNWLFFKVLVNLALNKVGMPCDMPAAVAAMDEVDSWYIGEGWYSDGSATEKPQRDYYIPWAIQYYSILYSVFAKEIDPERAEKFRQRALAFGKQFVNWFDEDGAALPYGRSLAYRFAQVSFYSVCVYAGIEPLPLEVMKGIIVRNLAWWMDKPIFDRDGILTIGYCYPQLYMSERYNAPGSPYWAMKTFILMALPEDHPFWAAKAAPLPQMPPLTTLEDAHFIMQRLPDGQVNAYTPAEVEQNEHGQFAEKYGKFVYNTRFGFSASRSNIQLEQAAPDSMLAFVIDGWVFVRRHNESFWIEDNKMTSRWSPFVGIEVTTVLEPTEWGHVRKHVVKSNIACVAYDCGFAVPKFAEEFSVETLLNSCTAKNSLKSCRVQSETGGEGFLVEAWPNTSLYSPNTVIPAVKYDIQEGTTCLQTSVVSHANE